MLRVGVDVGISGVLRKLHGDDLPMGKPGTVIQFQKAELVAVPALQRVPIPDNTEFTKREKEYEEEVISAEIVQKAD